MKQSFQRHKLLTNSDMEEKMCIMQSKFIHQRIVQVEHNLGNLCSSMASYTRNLGKVRDKGDNLARTLYAYADTETLNRSLRNSLLSISDTISALQDYRQAEINRLEAYVVTELSAYESKCKLAKEDIEMTHSARQRVIQRQKELWRQQGKPESMAGNELYKAVLECSRTVKTLEESIDQFEQKKLHDLKRVLMNFGKIEILYHSRALELCTDLYNHALDISIDSDQEYFRNCLWFPRFGSVPMDLTTLNLLSGNKSRMTHAMSFPGSLATGEYVPTPHTSFVQSAPSSRFVSPQVSRRRENVTWSDERVVEPRHDEESDEKGRKVKPSRRYAKSYSSHENVRRRVLNNTH